MPANRRKKVKMATGENAAEGNGSRDNLEVRDSHEDEHIRIELLADKTNQNGYITITPKSADAEITEEVILGYLESQKVEPSAGGRENITRALAAIAKGEGIGEPFPVASGRLPENGTDGSVRWLVQRPDVPQGPKSPGARIDYKERNAIVNIRQGQKILTMTEATPGTPGHDIFGNQIPCQQGRPVNVRRGKNVEFSEDGETLIALVSGYLQMSGDTVSVEPVFVVSADVDLSVGNIDFIGPVKVTKDVLDGFRIRAGQEIEVGGMVEGAVLESKSSIHIQGGVAGKGKGRIACKGDLDARYLNEVYVEVAGDVRIANSITNCTVKSHGRIDVASGGIRGANVVASKGLRSPEIGSDAGVRTMVVVGVDYKLKDKLVNIERDVSVVRETVQRIETALGPLLSDGEIISTLPPEKADAARRLLAQLDMLVTRGDDLASQRDTLLSKMGVDSKVCIEVGKKIFSGVVMQIGTCLRTFELDILGPVKLFPDIENGSVKVTR